MDAVEASELMAGMIEGLDNAFTDGEQKTWEAFKLLRGEGYKPVEIFELHRLKRELQLALADSPSCDGNSRQVKKILGEIEKRVK